MVSLSLCPLKICSIFIVKICLKIVKVATHKFKEGKEINMRCTERTTLRIDDNLKTRIQLLAIKNNFSMNKMFIYLLELGYRSYIERFEKIMMIMEDLFMNIISMKIQMILKQILINHIWITLFY